MKLLIARHAEDKGSEFIDDERVLTPKGILQANEFGDIIKNFNPTHIYSSTLQRAKQTAEIASKKCKIKVTKLKLINEQGVTNLIENRKELNKSKGYVSLDEINPNWESYNDIYRRSKEFYKLLMKKHKQDDCIVIVTHGRFMTFLIATIMGFEPNGFFLANNNVAYLIIEINQNWRPMIILPTAGELYI